ncbi:MAG: beta-N-acetylhexosaminidase, partial [Flammeovirgaceae bacterium]
VYASKIFVSATNELAEEATFLKNVLNTRGYQLLAQSSEDNLTIRFTRVTYDNPESYQLKSVGNIIEVSGSRAGVFRAVQSLLQILPLKAEPNFSIKSFEINDTPQFGWRGIMLDVSRHFFTVEEVKKYLDVMAFYKFNTLHWHLTDDEGWRVEIKSLPALTQKGSVRAVRHGKFGTRSMPSLDEPKTDGGFYTHDQVKDIIAYAARLHITIVPEIDVPGHSMALLAAYPELSTRKEPKQVSCGFKFSEWYGDGTFKMLIENTLNPADEKVYDLLDKIFTEIAALFPNEFIHVGGDEAYHGYWENDAGCKKLMKEKGLANSLELQSYFMKRVEKIITSKKKKMIGWDEILYGGLAEGAAVMSWRGFEGGLEAAQKGHKVVMSPTQFCYLDYTQSDHTLEFPIYNDLTIKKAYDFNPLPKGINPKMVMGGQANLWTEQIPTLEHAFYMTYPRALATSETLWSGEAKKNWNWFTKKLDHHFRLFDNQQIPVCKAVYDPFIKVTMQGDKLMATLWCEYPGAELHYTYDNTFPTQKSNRYTAPFAIPDGNGMNIRVAAFYEGKPIGRMLSIPREELVKRIGAGK